MAILQEHMKGPEAQARELEELTQIYVGRGLNYYLAKQVSLILSSIPLTFTIPSS